MFDVPEDQSNERAPRVISTHPEVHTPVQNTHGEQLDPSAGIVGLQTAVTERAGFAKAPLTCEKITYRCFVERSIEGRILH